MIWNEIDGLLFEGEHRSGLDLMIFAQEQVYEAKEGKDNWKIAIWSFVLEWLDPNTDSIEQASSGSTGEAKVISLKKQAMLNSAQNTLGYLKIPEGRKVLLAISAEYIGGKMMILRAMLGKHELFYVKPQKNPFENFQEEDDMALMAVVPYQLKEMLKSPVGLDGLSTVLHVLVGGAPVDDELLQELPDPFPFIHATYGMTETSSHVALQPLNHAEPGFFKLLSGIKGNVDARGCLIIDAPDLYCEDLATNDLVVFRTSDEFQVMGRYDNIINSGGVKISPEKLEDQLRRVIRRPFFVSWLPSEKFGQEIMLIIEGVVDQELVMETVNFMNSEFAKFEKAKAISFVKKFARTQTGKIRREATRKRVLKK